MAKPLREEINDVVEKHLADKLRIGEPVDVPGMAQEMAQCLVDMIMEQNEELQAPLLASAIASLGDEYLQRHVLIQATGRERH
jgi:hypothetical protein